MDEFKRGSYEETGRRFSLTFSISSPICCTSLKSEKALAEALKERRINQYVFETERLMSSPLQNIEHAIAFKPISRKTQESINRSKASWVTNIANMAGVSTS